jgi:hypothetical protein
LKIENKVSSVHYPYSPIHHFAIGQPPMPSKRRQIHNRLKRRINFLPVNRRRMQVNANLATERFLIHDGDSVYLFGTSKSNASANEIIFTPIPAIVFTHCVTISE